ncbi:pentapeptide repeat-containing protein [Actinopolyspora halophila]|uniref:pentapeptide repeat-containing protein n=1 Tax=Actinopolyspora halophila TaxID=1850 RepID=UPI0006868B83|nr:pentapeptide repeat-containing protein [Actinopolyspora halophila]
MDERQTGRLRQWWTWFRRSSWGVVTAVLLIVVGVLAWIPVGWEPLLSQAGNLLVVSGLLRLPGLLTLAGVGLLLALLVPRVTARTQQREEAADSSGASVRPIPGWAIWLGLAVLLTVGAVTAVLLVAAFGSGSEQDKVRLEAIKLAGSIAVGTGGAAALVLAARKQRATELGVIQQEQAQRLQERKAEQAKHDADERRVTELYTAAAQQLASEQAPVRMAGLYALSRLGQNNPDHRQTIVNLFCAYLRMPYTPPDVEETSSEQEDGQVRRLGLRSPERARQGSSPLSTLLTLAPSLAAAGNQLADEDYQRQELQVRLTAQRLLAHHLRPEADEQHRQVSNEEFWRDIDLDLEGATLYRWDANGCRVRHANFTYAEFHGLTWFDRAEFHGLTRFDGAEFHDLSRFIKTEFHSLTWFDRTRFYGQTLFDKGGFHGLVWFSGAEFQGSAEFARAEFHDLVWFDRAEFHNVTRFASAEFHSVAGFESAEFQGSAEFARAEFHSVAWFASAEFYNIVRFGEARFHGPILFAWVRIYFDHYGPAASTAPVGWIIRERDPGGGCAGRWGEFVPEEEAVQEETASGVELTDPNFVT